MSESKCIPEPFCRCCECQKILCMMWHPGHSHKDHYVKECEACGGTGNGPDEIIYVTRNMAVDAGDLSLEGERYSTSYAKCSFCQGDGWVYE